MLNQKTAARHGEANAAAAAHVVRNRASQPLVIVLCGPKPASAASASREPSE